MSPIGFYHVLFNECVYVFASGTERVRKTDTEMERDKGLKNDLGNS